jgi:ribosomal protein S15P/S13E
MAPLQARIARIRGQIAILTRSQRISPEQARHLFHEARDLDSRVREESYEGDLRAMRGLEDRVERLEQRVRYAASYGYRGYGNSYGYNGYYGGDRDDRRWGGDDDGD